MSARRGKKAPGSPQDWLRHAQSDLDFALLGSKEPRVLREQVCFHAQQAIEKALKALLLHHGVPFPLVHDIEELLLLLRASGMDLPDWEKELAEVTPYAVEARYPGMWEEVLPSDSVRALELAARTVEWVRDILSA